MKETEIGATIEMLHGTLHLEMGQRGTIIDYSSVKPNVWYVYMEKDGDVYTIHEHHFWVM